MIESILAYIGEVSKRDEDQHVKCEKVKTLCIVTQISILQHQALR